MAWACADPKEGRDLELVTGARIHIVDFGFAAMVPHPADLRGVSNCSAKQHVQSVHFAVSIKVEIVVIVAIRYSQGTQCYSLQYCRFVTGLPMRKIGVGWAKGGVESREGED